jgi:hypothetical protein
MKHTTIVLCFIVVYHWFVINQVEKRCFRKVLPQSIFRRPNGSSFGFPSNHVEAATLALSLLSENRVVPWFLSLLLIVAVGIQRVYTKNHTWIQVVAGAFFGALYALLYTRCGFLLGAVIVTLFWFFFLFVFLRGKETRDNGRYLSG